MQSIKITCAILFTLVITSINASASALVLENPGSQFPTILGVEDLEVDNFTYDVYFGRGEYNTLYLGEGEPLRLQADRGPFERDIAPDLFDQDPYIFPELSQAESAWQALIDFAFTGSLFDTRPQLTNSCGIPASCTVYTPYGAVGDVLDGRVSVVLFSNFFGAGLDGLSIGTAEPSFRTENDSAYAVWFLTAGGDPVDPEPVPLPSSVIAFLSGLFVFLNLSKSFTGRR